MNILYDVPIEVTKEQHSAIKSKLAGCIAHRIENGRYYIKLWLIQYKQDLLNILNDETVNN